VARCNAVCSHRNDQTQRVGELSLVNPDGTTVECDLVLMSEWKTKLPEKFPH
jgi:hypothetical protein